MLNMPFEARILNADLTREGFGSLDGQVLSLAEEVGEFVGAYRRWTNRARRSDTKEHVVEELCDVIITAYVMAARLEVNIDPEISAKIHEIYKRGWREVEGFSTYQDCFHTLYPTSNGKCSNIKCYNYLGFRPARDEHTGTLIVPLRPSENSG